MRGLTLSRIERIYPGSPPVHALRPLDLSVSFGELVGIVGRSGSGKSTLLNVLGLLDRPTAGSYILDEMEVCGLSEQQQAALRSRMIGFVFQQAHLLADRNVLENVELGLIPRRERPASRRIKAWDALERVGMAHRAYAFPKTLSGGEAQRVVIARAVAQAPPVLLCDEPTGNLDSANAELVLKLLRELNRTGQTVLIVTHDERMAAELPRRLVVADGRVREEEPAAGTDAGGEAHR